MVLNPKMVECPLWARAELLPQVEELKFSWGLLREEGSKSLRDGLELHLQ